ncbi:DUF7674 family protein [Parapedobacter sp. DT-150]|uniref:DUF7674 family protein n=1 Tax=Parapedobacter sp. DT-150 TaxID=3396162 RepID=UPI003F1C9CF1
METKIIKTLKEWIPSVLIGKDGLSDYEALQKVADYCLEKIHGSIDERVSAVEAIKVVNLLYMNGSLHDRNAIENEFLCVLASDDTPASLKKHLELFPKEIKHAYLKTILEN